MEAELFSYNANILIGIATAMNFENSYFLQGNRWHDGTAVFVACFQNSKLSYPGGGHNSPEFHRDTKINSRFYLVLSFEIFRSFQGSF